MLENMKLLKTSQEFTVGKHEIGWVDTDFTREFSNTSFTKGKLLPTFELPRDMTGNEILKEYPNLCTLGNVLAYMKAEKDDCRFLVKGNSGVVVVHVYWNSGSREWNVNAWRLDAAWDAGNRFTPCTTDSSSDSLELRVKKLEERLDQLTKI